MKKHTYTNNSITQIKNWKRINWTASTKHIDIETGQVLTKYQTKHEKYIHITTEKDYTLDHNKTHGHVEYIKLYKRNPQLRLL